MSYICQKIISHVYCGQRTVHAYLLTKYNEIYDHCILQPNEAPMSHCYSWRNYCVIAGPTAVWQQLICAMNMQRDSLSLLDRLIASMISDTINTAYRYMYASRPKSIDDVVWNSLHRHRSNHVIAPNVTEAIVWNWFWVIKNLIMCLASNCLQITSLIRKKSYRWLPLKKLAKAHLTDTGVFMLLPQCHWSNLLKGTCFTGTGVIIYLPKSCKCYWINLLEWGWVNTWNH